MNWKCSKKKINVHIFLDPKEVNLICFLLPLWFPPFPLTWRVKKKMEEEKRGLQADPRRLQLWSHESSSRWRVGTTPAAPQAAPSLWAHEPPPSPPWTAGSRGTGLPTPSPARRCPWRVALRSSPPQVSSSSRRGGRRGGPTAAPAPPSPPSPRPSPPTPWRSSPAPPTSGWRTSPWSRSKPSSQSCRWRLHRRPGRSWSSGAYRKAKATKEEEEKRSSQKAWVSP